MDFSNLRQFSLIFLASIGGGATLTLILLFRTSFLTYLAA
jgi:hypothetical protein